MGVNISEILKGIGFVAGVFNSSLGNGLIAVSSIVDKFDGVPDDVLENNVKGLNLIISDLESIVERNSNLMLKKDVDLLKNDIQELKSINKFINKFQKIIS